LKKVEIYGIYEFFPHLVLCGEVEKQLACLGIQSKFFDQIIEKLKRLNEYARNWQNGSYVNGTLLASNNPNDFCIVKKPEIRFFEKPDFWRI